MKILRDELATHDLLETKDSLRDLLDQNQLYKKRPIKRSVFLKPVGLLPNRYCSRDRQLPSLRSRDRLLAQTIFHKKRPTFFKVDLFKLAYSRVASLSGQAGLPESLRSRTGFSPKQFPTKKDQLLRVDLFKLAYQGSNLDSSGPKPDVLPVTP